ncbi:hypothetical protein [Nocardia alba]|uniref:DUF4333 domain-containing protein n=1 Tax=Nocardia alba TaxID=225051 RepID=A0A4R1FND5_9NOCA|nr:hypothetical protein [Nocardia alba]TCJ93798.1 hypothetical protein DFR71_5655 [Nocardia alba]
MTSFGGLRRIAVCAAVCVVAGCGSDSSDAAGTAQAPASSIRPSAEACGGADRIENAVSEFGVTDVSIVGQCTSVVIATTLVEDLAGSDTAHRICSAAAAVAYTGDVTSISVTGVTGSELAIGIEGASCIGD